MTAAMMARSPRKTTIEVSSNDDGSSIRMDEAWQGGIRQRRGVGFFVTAPAAAAWSSIGHEQPLGRGEIWRRRRHVKELGHAKAS
jgi:hypothetical protein